MYTLDVKMMRDETPRKAVPSCDCWGDDDKGPTTLWGGPSDWHSAVFDDAPVSWKSGARMRVCGDDSRLGHMSLADGGVGIDIPLLVRRGAQQQPLYVQHGYCSQCDKFEWVMYSVDKPLSPIVWITCTK